MTTPLLLTLFIACKKQAPPVVVVDESTGEEEALKDEEFSGFFESCQEKAKVLAANHYKVFECPETRSASYYDSPETMTLEDVAEPLMTDARSRGYRVEERAAEASIGGQARPVTHLDYRLPESVGGTLKKTIVVLTHQMADGKTRVFQCETLGTAEGVEGAAANAQWCWDAMGEMLTFEKKEEAPPSGPITPSDAPLEDEIPTE